MDSTHENTLAHAGYFITVAGRLSRLNADNRRRVAVYITRGNLTLSEATLNQGGAFRLHLAAHLADAADVVAVVGPKGLDARSLAGRGDLPSAALSTGRRGDGGEILIDFEEIDDKLIDLWWLWCRDYTVSGTLDTAAGCPVGATVTVYTVTAGVSGLIRTALATVPTDANGHFMASFNWCSRPCWWPCWPVWWDCWPWWWELDILAVIENLERRLNARPEVSARAFDHAPIRQPQSADLMTGVGFASGRANGILKPDVARTALIAAKFANPRLRAIFPWWWWCCENPNIVFSAAQGANVVLDEDPNTSTRWCFASGQSVGLTGNDAAVGACALPPPGNDCAFAWTSVGDDPGGVAVGDIAMGYAVGSGACANLSFAGSLNLNGVFSGECAAFYQVLVGEWGGGGDPARGGTAPGALSPLAFPVQLVNQVSIWRNATLTVEVDNLILGPFSFNGYDHLYATARQRQTGGLDPAVIAQIGAFPALGGGDFVIGWSAPDLVLTAPAADLISPATVGGATLAIQPFDLAGNPLPAAPLPPDFHLGPSLTLSIDTTGLSAATLDAVTVYNSDGSNAGQTAASSSACPAYLISSPGGGYALVHTTVTDAAGHLCEYYVQVQYGDGSYASVTPGDRDYAQAPGTFTPPSATQLYGVDPGYGPPNAMPLPPPPPQAPAPGNWTFVGGGDTFYVPITESCCYDFQLWVSKRTTDGQTFACGGYNAAFQTVNITVAASA